METVVRHVPAVPGDLHVRVLLADDEELVRAGMRMLLRHAGDLEVVAEAGDGRRAVELARELNVDVVLMDIRMPGTDGLTALELLARTNPLMKVVMLTTFGEPEYLARALRAGATGFLLKDSSPEELIHAVRAAASGGAVLSPRIAREVVAGYLAASGTRAPEVRQRLDTLTAKEREVLVTIGLGLSNSEAARLLFMGEGTVKTYVSRILAKLRCANRVQAAIIAHDAGILPDRAHD